MNKINIILPPIIFAGFWSIIETLIIPFHPELTGFLSLILWLALTAYVFFHRLDYLASASAIIALAVENISYIYFTGITKVPIAIFVAIYALFIFYFVVGVVLYLKKPEETIKFEVPPPQPIILKGKEAETFLEDIKKPPTPQQIETVKRSLEEFPPTGSIVTKVGKEETFASHQNNEDIKKKLREKYLKD